MHKPACTLGKHTLHCTARPLYSWTYIFCLFCRMLYYIYYASESRWGGYVFCELTRSVNNREVAAHNEPIFHRQLRSRAFGLCATHRLGCTPHDLSKRESLGRKVTENSLSVKHEPEWCYFFKTSFTTFRDVKARAIMVRTVFSRPVVRWMEWNGLQGRYSHQPDESASPTQSSQKKLIGGQNYNLWSVQEKKAML